MATFIAHRCRVFIDEKDVSDMVHSLEVHAAVGDVCTISLELVGMPTIDQDGVIRISSGPPVLGAAVARSARGILIRGGE